MMIPTSVTRFAHFFTFHTLRNSLSSDQTLAQRVGNVAVYVLILSASFAVYSAFRCAFSKNSFLTRSFKQVAGILHLTKTPLQKNSYPKIGQEAFAFAREKLRENPTLAPTSFFSEETILKKTFQSVNQEIALLVTLYREVYLQNFESICVQYANHPLEEPKVIQAAGELIKIAYTINCLALENLEDSKASSALLEMMSTQSNSEQTGKETASYLNTAIKIFPFAFHRVLNLEVDKFKKELHPQNHTPKSVLMLPLKIIQPTSIELYNDYCERIRLYMTEDEIRYPVQNVPILK